MNTIYTAIKITWVVTMLAVLGWYVSTHWEAFSQYAVHIGFFAIATYIGFVVVAKLVLAQISVEALNLFSVRLAYWRVLLIYALSQLGKYVPGTVWQFVGRVALYRMEGLAPKLGTKVVIIENFWLFGSAATIGIAFCLERLLALSGLTLSLPGWFWAFTAAAALAAWLVALHYGTRLFANQFGGGPASGTRVYVLELVAWLFLGLSFWMLFPADSRGLETVPIAVGAFALGWAGGYLAPFAPAGIGVREAIIVALVADIMDVPVAVAVVSVSRVLYSITDLALGAAAGGWYRPKIAGSSEAPATFAPMSEASSPPLDRRC